MEASYYGIGLTGCRRYRGRSVAVLCIALMLLILGAASCRRRSDDASSSVDVHAFVSQTADVATDPTSYGGSMMLAYDILVKIKNVSERPVKFKYANIVLYSQDGDALLVPCFTKTEGPDPLQIEPGDTLSLSFDTDGYTEELQRSGSGLKLGLALSDDILRSGPVIEAPLPSLEGLAPTPAVAAGSAKPYDVKLVRGNSLDLESSRTPKKANEWLRQPAIMRDYQSYRLVFLYYKRH